MKKLTTFACVLLASASLGTRADISISWSTAVGVMNETAAYPIDVGTMFLAPGSLYVLYYAPTGAVDPLSPSGSLLPTGDDIVLAYANNDFSLEAVSVDDSVAGGGAAYTRIFNTQDFTAGGTDPNSYVLPDGTFYFESLTTPVAEYPGAPSPSTVVSADLGGTFGVGSLTVPDTPPFAAVTSQQFSAIPEPSVFGLLLIGMGVVARRARRD